MTVGPAVCVAAAADRTTPPHTATASTSVSAARPRLRVMVLPGHIDVGGHRPSDPHTAHAAAGLAG
jgi:hypothetical protein